MKAKDLIDLLKTVDSQTEIISPVGKEGFSQNYILYDEKVILDAPGKAANKPPYTLASNEDSDAVTMKILDCVWTKTFDFKERIKDKD